MSVNGAQILSCSNDRRVDDLTNKVDGVTRLLKPEKEMYEQNTYELTKVGNE